MKKIYFIMQLNNLLQHVNIPEKPTYESYNIMVDFAEKVEDELLKEKLTIALDGKGAFGRFKRVISDYPDYEKKWFEFKAERTKEEVMEWLCLIGIKGI